MSALTHFGALSIIIPTPTFRSSDWIISLCLSMQAQSGLYDRNRKWLKNRQTFTTVSNCISERWINTLRQWMKCKRKTHQWWICASSWMISLSLRLLAFSDVLKPAVDPRRHHSGVIAMHNKNLWFCHLCNEGSYISRPWRTSTRQCV